MRRGKIWLKSGPGPNCRAPHQHLHASYLHVCQKHIALKPSTAYPNSASWQLITVFEVLFQ